MVVLSQLHILTPVFSFHQTSFQNMMFRMLGSGHELQVCDSIVLSVAVYVMDNFSRKKIPTKMFFHDQPMLENIAGEFSVWVIWFPYQDISKTIYASSTLPLSVLISCIMAATFLKVTSITMSTNKHYWLTFPVIPALYFSAATTCAVSQESSNGGVGL